MQLKGVDPWTVDMSAMPHMRLVGDSVLCPGSGLALTLTRFLPHSCRTQLKGVGPWTVDMFAMFHLGRANVLPVGDLAVRKVSYCRQTYCRQCVR